LDNNVAHRYRSVMTKCSKSHRLMPAAEAVLLHGIQLQHLIQPSLAALFIKALMMRHMIRLSPIDPMFQDRFVTPVFGFAYIAADFTGEKLSR
jgi:hypothetical protein